MVILLEYVQHGIHKLQYSTSLLHYVDHILQHITFLLQHKTILFESLTYSTYVNCCNKYILLWETWMYITEKIRGLPK